MKRVLIPVDFTEKTNNTVNYAIHLASVMEFEIELLYIVAIFPNETSYTTPGEVRAMPNVSFEMEKQRKDAAEVSFEKLLEGLKKKHKKLPAISTIVRIGMESEMIELELKENDYDMLMLTGTDEKGFFAYLSSDNFKLIRNVDCPVLLIPPESDYRPPKNIVYGTDYNEEDIKTLKRLVPVAKPFGATINGIHIHDDQDFRKRIKEKGFEELIKEKTGYNDTNIYSVSGEDTEQSLMQFCEETDADLLVLLKENKNFFQQIFRKSTTKKISRKTRIPVLIYHE